MYIPWNAPVEALGRTLVFGEAESGVEAIAPMVKGENVGVGIGDRDGNDGDGDGTTSGGSVDLTRVNEALLAGKSQHMRQT